MWRCGNKPDKVLLNKVLVWNVLVGQIHVHVWVILLGNVARDIISPD